MTSQAYVSTVQLVARNENAAESRCLVQILMSAMATLNRLL